ncbi:hypothetical protein [Sphingomonas bacterium]|uniref:hypothetical protein n=1 Tax=Sphingomonas bacterium TaxID=1895847 RepID=UPI0015750674|nr:hypothetical protein [Sphingomonas bacterium]
MIQPAKVRRSPPPPSSRQDSYVFDDKNGLRIWLNEAVRRGEVSAHDAEQTIRSITPGQAIGFGEDYGKLLIGTIKDSFGSYKIAQKLVKDFHRWWGVQVYFKPGAKGDLVIIKGWPKGRELLSATRYRVDNPKIMELQIGKPGIQAAAKESARFGIVLVVAFDAYQFIRDHDLPHLLGSLTVDIPSVMLASAIGALAGTLAVGTVVVGTIALGPALLAFAVGAAVGIGLFALDKELGLTERATAAWERALDKLERWWDEAGAEASRRWHQFCTSGIVQDMENGFRGFGQQLGRAASSPSAPGSMF